MGLIGRDYLRLPTGHDDETDTHRASTILLLPDDPGWMLLACPQRAALVAETETETETETESESVRACRAAERVLAERGVHVRAWHRVEGRSAAAFVAEYSVGPTAGSTRERPDTAPDSPRPCGPDSRTAWSDGSDWLG